MVESKNHSTALRVFLAHVRASFLRRASSCLGSPGSVLKCRGEDQGRELRVSIQTSQSTSDFTGKIQSSLCVENKRVLFL